MSSEGSYMEGQIILHEKYAVIDMGVVDVIFYKPAEVERGKIIVEVYGAGETKQVTINSNTLIGALKALEAGHDRLKVYKEGRERWQNSTKQYQ